MPSYAQKLAALKAEQEKLKAEVVEEVEVVEEKAAEPTPAPVPAKPKQPSEFLNTVANAPTQEQIDAWKGRYNDQVFLLALREDDLYVWKYLEKKEWGAIQSQLKLHQDSDPEAFVQEQVLLKCVLWPRDKVLQAENAERLPAGLKDLLFEVIMAGSYFIAPEQALARVAKL